MQEGTEPVEQRVAAVIETVGDWPGISVRPHRYGGTEFRLGPREVGHVHRAGLVDIAFTRRLRDRLVAEGLTNHHHVYPDSGWTTFRLDGDAAVDTALSLLALSYLYHHRSLARRGSVPAIDEQSWLATRSLPSTVTATLETVVPTDDRRSGAT